MIAKGVRFNAEKKQVGNYYSTKVCIIKVDFFLLYFVLNAIIKTIWVSALRSKSQE